MELGHCGNIYGYDIIPTLCGEPISCFTKIAGTLTGEEIKEHGLIIPEPNSPDDNFQATTYDLTLGEGHYIYRGANSDKPERWELAYIGESDERMDELNSNKSFEQYKRINRDLSQTLIIPPYGSAFVQLNETVDTYTVAKEKGLLIVGRFDLKLSNVHQGLISQQATQVEPCYKGKLFCFIHNLSSQAIKLTNGQKMATIEFSYVSCFCNNKKRKEIIESLIAKNKNSKYKRPFCTDTGINDIRYFHEQQKLPNDCGLLGINDKVKEEIEKHVNSDTYIEKISKTIERHVDKKAKWIPVIGAIISLIATVALAILGLPERATVDKLEEEIEEQNQQIEELGEQIDYLLSNGSKL